MLSTMSNIATTSNLVYDIKTIYLTDENSINFIISKIERMIDKVSPYQVVTIIIAILGVIVNFLVVKTALLQYKTQIKLEISYSVQLRVDKIINKQILVFSLIVKNIGYTSVKISQWGYTSDKKLKMQILNINNDSFPIEILSRDTYSFKIPMRNLIENMKKHIDDKSINDKKLYFYVIDNLGKMYFLKFKENIQKFLVRESERCKYDNWDNDFY